MTNHNDEVAAVAATPTTQDAIDVLIERLNYWRSKAIAEAGEVEAMEAAYTELQQQLDYTQNSRDMFMSSAKAWRATAERNAAACAHWQSVALERKAERDELRLNLAGATESIDRVASRVIELDTQYNRAMLDLARCQTLAQIETNHKTVDACKTLRQRCAAIVSERDALKTDNTEMAQRIAELAAERNEMRAAVWAATRRFTELERKNGELQQRIDALRRANETLVAALRNSDTERDAIKRERDALRQGNKQVVDIDQGMLDTMLALYGSLGTTIEKFVELYQQIETEPSNE